MNTILTLLDVERIRSFYERGWWCSDTLYTLLRAWADQTPDRYALRDTNGRLTYRAALGWVDAIGQEGLAGSATWGNRDCARFYKGFIGEWHQ